MDNALADAGRSLSRDALADQMRDDGHGVSNARASQLLRILRADHKRQGVDLGQDMPERRRDGSPTGTV
jgi:hypothetical protein